MNPLRRLINAVTYRNHLTNDRAGLSVQHLDRRVIRYGHPNLAALAEARRRKAIRTGLDPADRALLDPATLAALHATACTMQTTRSATRRAA